MDFTFFADVQEALVIVFTPVVYGFIGIVFMGSILAALLNLFMDVAGHLFKS